MSDAVDLRYTVDAYARALHGNGQDAEARKQIETRWTQSARE
jgi:hypothetical protein